MIKRMEWEMVSRRRMFSFVGLAVASGLAFRPTDAEAQTSGMERRHGRVERRYERRGGTPASKAPAAQNPPAAQTQ
jgi:hypothetical protein